MSYKLFVVSRAKYLSVNLVRSKNFTTKINQNLEIIQKNISTRQLTVPIKRLIHFAGVAETTSKPEEFGDKLIQLLEEDNFLSDSHY